METETKAEAKPSYSISSLNTFELCPHSWYLQYIEKKWSKGSFYTIRGKAVHKAREENFSQKIKTRTDLPLSECEDASRDEIVKEFEEDKISMEVDEFKGIGKAGAINYTLNSTRPLVALDHRQQYPQILPKYVEEHIAIELTDEPFDLLGYLDLIDIYNKVIDAKVTGKKMSEADAKTNHQMSIYWLMANTFLGTTSPGGYLDIIYTRPKVPYIYTLPWTRTTEDVVKVLERFRTMHASMKLGSFPPCSQSSWKCSARWCHLHHECKYV